jgi:phage baseplate assembly protein W
MLVRQTYPIVPQDVGQPRGIGISALYNNGTNVFNTTTTTKEQVKSNLINFILTNKGERFFDPTFGGDLRASLFQPDSDLDSLSAKLEDEIYAYVPNIFISSIDIKKQSDYNPVNISINYSIYSLEDVLVINISTSQLTQQ